MERLLIALGIIVVAGVVAAVLRRRRTVDAPTQARHLAPTQLDRGDFAGRDRDWLLAVFTSATCHTCHDVARKAAVLACDSVEVAEVEYGANRTLHQRYRIEAVPTTVLADRDGVVRRAFMGPVTATDLWAAVAEARDPGTSPEPELGVCPEPGPGPRVEVSRLGGVKSTRPWSCAPRRAPPGGGASSVSSGWWWLRSGAG